MERELPGTDGRVLSGAFGPTVFKYPELYIQYWVVVSNIFYFHPCLGKIPILTNIFQMG